jgi:hypothetical protein
MTLRNRHGWSGVAVTVRCPLPRFERYRDLDDGVTVATYERTGEIKIGSFAPDDLPTNRLCARRGVAGVHSESVSE